MIIVNSKLGWKIFVGFTVLFVACLIYFPFFSSPFYHDDYSIIVLNNWIRHIPPGTWYGQRYFDSEHFFMGYRPTLALSYWLNYKLFPGTLEFSLRAGNMLILLANGFLLTKLVEEIWSSEKYVPWIIGALFVLHPIQILSIVYVWKRSTLLCTFFMLLGSYFCFRRIQNKEPVSFKFFVGQVICFAAAITSKEEAIIYPILVFCYSLLLDKKFRRHRKNWVAPSLLLVLFTDFAVFHFTRSHIWEVLFEPSRIDYLKQSLSVVGAYFRNMVWPQPLFFTDPDVFANWITVDSLITLLVLFLTIGVFRFTEPVLPKIAFLFIWLGFLPSSSLHPLFLKMDDIRMHLPLAGFSILLVYGTYRFLPKKVFYGLCIAISVVFAALTIQQSLKYSRPVSIWKEIVETYPKSKLGWTQMGVTLELNKDYRNATLAYQKAYEIDPTQVNSLISALNSRLLSGEPKEEIRKECRNIHIEKKQPAFSYFVLARLQIDLQMESEAIESLEKVVIYFPKYTRAYFMLGSLYARQGKYDISRKNFQKVLDIDPLYTEAIQALAKLPK